MMLGTWFYRQLLRLYPARFRARYAEEMVATFEALMARPGAIRRWCSSERSTATPFGAP